MSVFGIHKLAVCEGGYVRKSSLEKLIVWKISQAHVDGPNHEKEFSRFFESQ